MTLTLFAELKNILNLTLVKVLLCLKFKLQSALVFFELVRALDSFWARFCPPEEKRLFFHKIVFRKTLSRKQRESEFCNRLFLFSKEKLTGGEVRYGVNTLPERLA